MTNKMKATNGNLSMLEFYKAIDLDLHCVYEKNYNNGKIEPRYLEDYRFGGPHPLFEIEKFVREIESSEEVAFRVLTNKHGEKELKRLKLAKHLPLMDFYMVQFCGGYDYSVHVNLFFESCRELDLDYGRLGRNPYLIYKGCNGDITVAALFNDLICLIRKAVRAKEFTRKFTRRQRDSEEHYQKLEKYINRLFQRHEKLLVLRFDLSYLPKARRIASDTGGGSNQVAASNVGITTSQTSQEEAKADLERLLNYARSKPKLFGDRVGHIWKLEFCKFKGYHFHVIFLYNGLKRLTDPYLAGEIGRYWIERITEGRGYFHNCDVDSNIYKRCGIGGIERGDREKRQIFLRDGIGYLTNTDQYLRVKLTQKFRPFETGKLLPEPATRKPARKKIDKAAD